MLVGERKDPLIDALREREQRARNGSDCWSFREPTIRRGAHALIHYPAMMVPSLQGLIIDCIQGSGKPISTVLDPFVGSGTILVESMERGLGFAGVDINPLAGLACLAKAGPYFSDAFDARSTELLGRLKSDRKTYKARSFPGRDKWFETEISSDLEKIARHIRREPVVWARRLFWLALCRVVRATCNSRISTYKLHAIESNTQRAPINALIEFANVVAKFSVHVREQQRSLCAKGFLNRGRYCSNLQIEIGDTQTLIASGGIGKHDLIMTSPPYGDNVTTIPYGQYSFLPLQWVDLEDVGIERGDPITANTHATDTASLGGRLIGYEEKREALSANYEVAGAFIKSLHNQENGRKRFVSFFFDLDATIQSIASATGANGIHAWTVSNRRICGQEVPMVSLLGEMLGARGIVPIGRISRSIRFKKMATKNSMSATMSSETILLARKTKGANK